MPWVKNLAESEQAATRDGEIRGHAGEGAEAAFLLQIEPVELVGQGLEFAG